MCERFGRWGETGKKINVLAFYTSWSGFNKVKSVIIVHVLKAILNQ